MKNKLHNAVKPAAEYGSSNVSTKGLKIMFTLLLFAILLFGQDKGFGQTTLARWNFEGVATTGTNAILAPVITGSLAADSGALTAGSLFSAQHISASTVWSNPAGNGSAKSVSSNFWAVGDYYQFKASTVGYSNISITWDQTGSGTGPRDFKVQYSLTGLATSFTDVPGGAYALNLSNWSAGTPQPGHTRTLDLSSITSLNNQPSVYIRLTLASTAVRIDGTAAVATAGTGRVDNFKFTSCMTPNIFTFGTLSTVCYSADPRTSSLDYLSVNNAPVSYSIDWADMTDQATTTFAFPSSGGTIPGIVIPAGAAAGTHTGTMTITNACGLSYSFSISILINTPPSLTASHTPATGTSSNGSVTVTATGNGPFTGAGTFPGLAAGDYTYTVTDANGCTAQITETVNSVNPVPTLGEWGMISLAILVLSFGVFFIRNKIV